MMAGPFGFGIMRSTLRFELVELSDGALVEEILDGVVILENGFNNREVPTKHVQLGLRRNTPRASARSIRFLAYSSRNFLVLAATFFARRSLLARTRHLSIRKNQSASLPLRAGLQEGPLAFSRGSSLLPKLPRGSHLRPPWRRVGEACPTQGLMLLDESVNHRHVTIPLETFDDVREEAAAPCRRQNAAQCSRQSKRAAKDAV